MSTIKVFQLDDIEWWAGESLAACLAEARRQCGDECYTEAGDQSEVSEEAMHRLQRLKAECGYADRDAVEVYPRERDVVNVANLRHLWVMREPLAFAWRGGDRDTRAKVAKA
jgi:hypothetical protein